MINNLKSLCWDLKNLYFPKRHPFGKKPVASKEFYLSKLNQIKIKNYENVNLYEQEVNFKVDNNWLNNLALHTQIVKKKSEINYQHGRLLYSCLRDHIYKNNLEFINILEIGTARGFSSICMSKAINDSNIIGEIHTIDIIPNDLKIFWNCIDDHEGPKTRNELLEKWKNELKNINFITGPSRYVLKKYSKNKIDFAFIDGMHNYINVKREFNFISSLQKKGDKIIFDDVNEKFVEVKNFLEEINLEKKYIVKILDSSRERSYAICEKI